MIVILTEVLEILRPFILQNWI